MATKRPRRKTDNAVIQSTDSYEVTTVDVLVLWCSLRLTRYVSKKGAERSFDEMSDTILLYGEAERNSAAASRLYAERYPQRRHPNRRTFISQECRKTGRMRPIMTNADRPRSRSSADVEEDVLRAVQRPAGASIRRLARRHQISQRTVVRVLHDQLLYPFHVQHVQALQPPLDCDRRRAFCEWLLQQDAAYPTFLSRVLVMDEACSTRNGILNTRNQHTWDDENPHSFRETRFQ
jgi:hypothetical protein